MAICTQINTIPFLLEKLDGLKFTPTHVLLICASEQSDASNTKGSANILDTANDVLHQQVLSRYPQARIEKLKGDIKQFPLQENHYHLMIAHWLTIKSLMTEDPDPALLFYLFHHLLAPGGILLFSTTGPESMQMLGDLLVKSGYQDPVMDRDVLPSGKETLELIYGLAWKQGKETSIQQKGCMPINIPIKQIS